MPQPSPPPGAAAGPPQPSPPTQPPEPGVPAGSREASAFRAGLLLKSVTNGWGWALLVQGGFSVGYWAGVDTAAAALSQELGQHLRSALARALAEAPIQQYPHPTCGEAFSSVYKTVEDVQQSGGVLQSNFRGDQLRQEGADEREREQRSSAAVIGAPGFSPAGRAAVGASSVPLPRRSGSPGVMGQRARSTSRSGRHVGGGPGLGLGSSAVRGGSLGRGALGCRSRGRSLHLTLPLAGWELGVLSVTADFGLPRLPRLLRSAR